MPEARTQRINLVVAERRVGEMPAPVFRTEEAPRGKCPRPGASGPKARPRLSVAWQQSCARRSASLGVCSPRCLPAGRWEPPGPRWVPLTL